MPRFSTKNPITLPKLRKAYATAVSEFPNLRICDSAFEKHDYKDDTPQPPRAVCPYTVFHLAEAITRLKRKKSPHRISADMPNEAAAQAGKVNKIGTWPDGPYKTGFIEGWDSDPEELYEFESDDTPAYRKGVKDAQRIKRSVVWNQSKRLNTPITNLRSRKPKAA